jgi:hypothetical protein
MKARIYNLGALNLKISPFLSSKENGADLLRAVNIERDTIGAWKKRPGYTTYLGTPDNDQVTTLFSWTQNDGATLLTYRKSGSILYYSTGGTGAWTVVGNGTLTANSHVGNVVVDNILLVGDGTAFTRHSVGTTAGQAGTSFGSTTGAPLAEHWTDFQGRAWGARGTAVTGTNTDAFYSTTGTISDWTTDSSSIRIPGAGRVNSLFKANDRLVPTKDSGNIFNWDGFSLVDKATDLGPSSPYSIGKVEDYRIYLNRRGVFGYGGGRPEILSNAIERQIYNDRGSGIAGTVFDSAPGVIHKYDWFCGVGTVTDNLTDETIKDCVLKYDYQLNEWVNWKFFNRPYSFHSYKDKVGVEQLIFGDNGGQCYQLSGTATSDNGKPIESLLMFAFHAGAPESDKEWKYAWLFFNPGCLAKVQVAMADTFTKDNLNWIDLTDPRDGVSEVRFPAGSSSKFLFCKIYETGTTSPWQFYGASFEFEVKDRR